MRCEWLIRTGRKKLLLFFNGWGMDRRPFRRMTSKTHDVLVFFDYTQPDWSPDFTKMLAGYSHYDLAAWSMGVWAASRIWAYLPVLEQRLAINGTLRPIDPDFGINPVIFSATLESLSRLGCRAFYNNMFSDKKEFEQFYDQRPERSFEDQHAELAQLQTLILTQPAPEATWDAAFISRLDRIIPAANQSRFWRDRAICQPLATGHFPFYLWKEWEAMLHGYEGGQTAGTTTV